VLSHHNIPYNGRARQLTRGDLSELDYVVAMDHDNLSVIQRYANGSQAEIGLFLSYARKAGMVTVDEVPDPYYSGDEAFNHVYDLVVKGSQALLKHIRSQHQL